jgi:hypothetical protein
MTASEIPPEDPNDRGMEMLGCLLVLGSAAVSILVIVTLFKIFT